MASSSSLPPARFNILGHMMQMNPAALLSRPPHLSSTPRVPVSSSSSEEDESPLDFSNKAKFSTINNENIPSPVDVDEDEHEVDVDIDVVENNEQCSQRLRSALSMKSPSTILNLSSVTTKEESPMSQCSSRSWSRASSPLSPSPVGGEERQFHQQQQQPATTTTTTLPMGPFVGGNNGYPLSFSPWGVPGFPTNLSPGNGLEQKQQQFHQQHELLREFQQQQTSPNFGVSATQPQQQQQQQQSTVSGSSGGKVRATRPFKAYPKDVMSFPTVGMYGVPLGSTPTGSEALLHQQSHQAYTEFRKQMLASSQLGRGRRVSSSMKSGSSEEGHSFGSMSVEPLIQDDPLSNSNKRISSGSSGSVIIGDAIGGKSEQQMKDEAYWERRRKNNEAAKRSRDARRAKEDEIAIRAAFLEQENLKLRFEVCALKSEAAKLRCMLYST
ncbi:protein giant [Folsomia candida]|uniref:Protein giant n=1 Tax=Folsomia candida TaxID=158441 RepID=A0A226ER28_FOLCA|nr:protein giant [Folsomia candida]XP_035704024.1 protein giant [Folsomia candida]OXA59494.1 Protein giant [Folsomia candida]